MPASCNCGPNSPLARALGCHCLRRGTAVIASQLPLPRLQMPLFRIISGAISSELALPFTFIQRYIHISDNNMLHVTQYLFHKFLFVYFFFLVLTSLWHYCNILFAALLVPFSDEKHFGTALNNAQLMHPLNSGIHNSKHAYVTKVDILNIYVN